MMKRIFFIVSALLLGTLLLNAQQILENPSVYYRSDERVTIQSIELDNNAQALVVNLVFANESPGPTGIWMDYTTVSLIQGDISIACKGVRGLSRNREVIPGGYRKSFSMLFDVSLFKEEQSFDIVEDAANGWRFRGIEGVSFGTSGRLGSIRKEVEEGNRDAINRLGLMYYNGDGVPKDFSKALTYFMKAAEGGLPVAYGNVGALYLWGSGVTADASKARQWFEAGSRLGDYNSQYHLGTMYRDGNGVLKNPVKAKELFLKSARAGNTAAQYELAMICKKEDKLTEAFNWFKQCADGNSDAQYELGLMYYYAKGTEKNNQQAAYWIKRAYENGHGEARKVWDGLELWKYDK